MRSVYSGGKWNTYEPGASKLTTRSAKEEGTTTLRNGRYAEGVVQTLGEYKGHTFHIRAVHDGKYWLSTNKHIDIEGLDIGAVYGTAPLLFYNNLFAKYLTGYHTAA